MCLSSPSLSFFSSLRSIQPLDFSLPFTLRPTLDSGQRSFSSWHIQLLLKFISNYFCLYALLLANLSTLSFSERPDQYCQYCQCCQKLLWKGGSLCFSHLLLPSSSPYHDILYEVREANMIFLLVGGGFYFIMVSPCFDINCNYCNFFSSVKWSMVASALTYSIYIAAQVHFTWFDHQNA